MSKIGSALAASQRRKEFDEDADENTSPNPTKRPQLDFMGPQEAERRAGKLIAAIGRDHAALVAETLKFGF